VIGKQVKLQRAGREWKACCPFHNEKTPSFTVNDEKGFYHCFGCGAHGDAIRFLTDARGLQFMDAVKELADAGRNAGPRRRPAGAAAGGAGEGPLRRDGGSRRWFEEQLGGIEARERGLSGRARHLRGHPKAVPLRLCAGQQGKLKAALAQFGIEMLVEAGLLIEPDGDREPYDRFRGRLTYPIRTSAGG
jgi:DNA primase